MIIYLSLHPQSAPFVSHSPTCDFISEKIKGWMWHASRGNPIHIRRNHLTHISRFNLNVWYDLLLLYSIWDSSLGIRCHKRQLRHVLYICIRVKRFSARSRGMVTKSLDPNFLFECHSFCSHQSADMHWIFIFKEYAIVSCADWRNIYQSNISRKHPIIKSLHLRLNKLCANFQLL